MRGYATGVARPVAMGFDAATNREDDSEIDTFRQRGIPGIEIEDTYANVKQRTAGDTADRVSTRSHLNATAGRLGLAGPRAHFPPQPWCC